MNDTLTSEPSHSGGFLASRAVRPLFIACLIVYFIYLLVANVPARLAAWALHEAMPNVWLTSVSGTLWNGRAGGAQLDLPEKSLALGEVRWSLSPWSLLMLRPCLDFETRVPGQMASGYVCRSPTGSTIVKDLTLDMPIAAIGDLLPMEASGQISLQVVRADMTPASVKALDARFSWQNASVHTGENWMGLGAFGGDAKGDGNGGIAATMFEISGPFSVDLAAQWTPGNANWNINGTVKPERNAPAEAVNGLRIFGEEIETGVFRVQWP